MKIEKRNSYHIVVDYLESEIKEKRIIPGTKLPSERFLSKKLSVSRTSVKEALSVFQSSGLIKTKHGSGSFLLNNNTNDLIMKVNLITQQKGTKILDLMELRQAVEGQAAFLAAQRLDEEDINNMEKAYSDLKKAVQAGQIAAQEDLNFHLSIARASKNLLFIEVMYTLSSRLLSSLEKSRIQTLKGSGKPKEILREHYKVLDLIKNREPHYAKNAMIDHLENVKKRYL